MTRICHISTLHSSHDPRIFHRECRSLAKAGYDVHLVVPANHAEETPEGIHIHAVGKAEITVTQGLNSAVRLKRFWRALRLSSRIQAKLYHLHDPELIPLGIWLKLKGKQVIFDCHENNTAYIDQKRYLPRLVRMALIFYMTLIEQLAAWFFDAIITADQGVADFFRNRYKAHHVQTLHNFPRLELFALTACPPVEDRPFDLVYHGTIPQYHLETAFEVAQVLRTRGVDAKWLFFGRCPVIEWAIQEIKRHGLENTFVLDPNPIPQDQVGARVCQAKIGFIPLPDYPKFQHNIPSKLFEFMALGMPTVLSDLPPSRPFVGDGNCAIMVPPTDYGAYADAITSLLCNPVLYRKMAYCGRERVLEKYNWQTEAENLLDIYSTLTERKPQK